MHLNKRNPMIYMHIAQFTFICVRALSFSLLFITIWTCCFFFSFFGWVFFIFVDCCTFFRSFYNRLKKSEKKSNSRWHTLILCFFLWIIFSIIKKTNCLFVTLKNTRVLKNSGAFFVAVSFDILYINSIALTSCGYCISLSRSLRVQCACIICVGASLRNYHIASLM